MTNKNKESKLEKETWMDKCEHILTKNNGRWFKIGMIGMITGVTIPGYFVLVSPTEKSQIQNTYREQFLELDKNKDCVLDSTEFYNFYKEKK